jgi:PRTRC genetic system protein B
MDMTDVKEVEGMRFTATAALIVHELEKVASEEGYMGQSEIPNNFVTLHRIRNGEVCEGYPITRMKLLNLCKRILPSLDRDLSYLPENVIAFSPYNTTLLWWIPGGIRHLFFDESTHIKSGQAPVPPLIFRYNDMGLTLFALKEDRRPTPETDIWHSPFWNWGCMGNVNLPKKVEPSDTKALEALFFRSAFTFHNPPRLRGATGDGLWKSLVGTEEKEFPYECLVKAGKVKTLLKGGASDY